MDNRDEVRAFLTTRRARITPERAGLVAYSRNRRVPGLRRSEVADLAGVSVEYYAQLERGNLSGVSESVLEALARGLQLDEAERAHLFALARAAGPAPRARRTPQARQARQVRPGLARILDGMTRLPALANNGRLDVLATNSLARALFTPMFTDPPAPADRPANHARFNFLDPRARDFWIDWERTADETVAILRTEAGRDPYDKALTDLVGELCTRSNDFRVRWAAHDVRLHHTGLKHIHHPVVGDLHLSYDVMELPADPGLTLTAFSAEADSPTDDALKVLASWAATHHPAGSGSTTGPPASSPRDTRLSDARALPRGRRLAQKSAEGHQVPWSTGAAAPDPQSGAMSLFDDAKQKAEKAAQDHPDQVEKVSDQAVERGGDAADHVTGDKYGDEVGTAQKKADEHIGE